MLQGQAEWVEELVDFADIDTQKYYQFGFGFAAGALPTIAMYSSNVCIAEGADWATKAFKAWTYNRYIEDLKARGEKVKWYHWAKLTLYTERALTQLPVAERACSHYWEDFSAKPVLTSALDKYETIVEYLEDFNDASGLAVLLVDIDTGYTYYKEEDWVMTGYYSGLITVGGPLLLVDNYNFFAEIFEWQTIDLHDWFD